MQSHFSTNGTLGIKSEFLSPFFHVHLVAHLAGRRPAPSSLRDTLEDLVMELRRVHRAALVTLNGIGLGDNGSFCCKALDQSKLGIHSLDFITSTSAFAAVFAILAMALTFAFSSIFASLPRVVSFSSSPIFSFPLTFLRHGYGGFAWSRFYNGNDTFSWILVSFAPDFMSLTPRISAFDFPWILAFLVSFTPLCRRRCPWVTI